MAGGFERKYTDQQRDAIAHAYEDRRVRPASKVVAMAAAGELEHDGQPLPAFKCTQNTVRDFAQKLRKRRRGELTTKLAHAAPRDAIETLRQRLVSAADTMLADLERQLQRDASTTDPERLRQITRAVREASSLPGPDDPRPKAPGAKTDGRRDGGETKGGLAGDILREHRTGDEQPAHDASPTPRGEGHHDTGDDGEHERESARVNTTEEQHDDGSPGALVRALAARGSVAGAQ
jgi:hypothetical protein